MRAFLVFATLPFPFVVTFSLNPFDLGFLGFYPRQRFHSVAFEPPTPKQTQWNDRCDFGYLFLTPRGWAVPSPGPVMLDAKGNLVWMENKFGQALNFNVQKYKGQDHMTFWTGTDSAGVTINGSYTIVGFLLLPNSIHENSSDISTAEFFIRSSSEGVCIWYRPRRRSS